MDLPASTTTQLEIMDVSLSDAGHYECRITFTNGDVDGPVSMGHLTVIGTYVREGGITGNGS